MTEIDPTLDAAISARWDYLMRENCREDRRLDIGVLIPPIVLGLLALGWAQAVLAALHILAPVAIIACLLLSRRRATGATIRPAG